jgi:hypothetical protein
MRPGVGWIIAGVCLLGVGIGVTLVSQAVVWYGAMIVGVIWIVRGIYRLVNAPPQSPREPS